MAKKDGTFTVRYTNKDIMDKIDQVLTAQAVTNGTIKWHTKAIYTGGGAIVVLAGWIIKLSLLK